MTTEFTEKQPYEAYAISFDFTSVLGAETISSATIEAIDREDSSDVTATLLDATKQSETDTVVYGWVRAGTSGHSYVITCQIVGSGASLYELEGIQTVTETPDTGTSSGGGLVVAPVIEPISLAELKLHLRLDSGSFADNVDEVQSLKPDSYVIAANYTTHVGTGIDVLGYNAVVVLNSGTNVATGTVDVKIQESDDDSTYTDWTGGAFTQVTTANDNAIQEKAYTGTKQYIRTVAQVLLATCDFGTTVIRLAATSYEDDLLTDLIQAAREHVEDITRRALLTQTWDYCLDKFPDVNYIVLPLGNLQSVTHVKYTDSDGDETTMTVTTEYIVETNGTMHGRIVLPYGVNWPSFTAYSSNPIVIRFVCGWTSAAALPSKIRTAIKLICTDMYVNREAQVFGISGSAYQENQTVRRLLASSRLWTEF